MNQLNKLVVILALATLLGSAAAQAHKFDFDKIIAFGESSSDTGTVFEKQCPPDPAWGPWAPCSTAYYDGNLTNGPQWIEFLARRLRVPRPEPSELGGTNYAHAGAKTGEGDNLRVSLVGFGPSSGTPGTEVPGVLAQVNMYLAERGGFDNKDVVVIWGGANDLRDIQNPAEELPVVIGNLVEAIATAACTGAKHIVVPNQLNASISPAVRLSGANPAQVEAVVRAFNDALRTTVSTLDNNPIPPCGAEPTIYYVDMFSVGEAVVAISKLFGRPFSNIEDPAVDLTTLEINVDDPNKYLFLDTIHLTTPAQRILAATAYRAIKFRRRSRD